MHQEPPSPARYAPRSHTYLRALLLIGLAGTLTLIMQLWVGGAAIYHPDLDGKRQAVHGYLIENRLPPGHSWTDHGVNSSNIRIAAPYLAAGIARATGLSVEAGYWLIDTLALFSSLLLLFLFLRRWYPDVYALLGLLYVGTVLPLTYFLHYFHPWDRLSLLTWLVALLLLRDNRLVLLGIVLALGVAVKFDILLLPGLLFLAAVSRDNWRPLALHTALLFAVSVGTYALLRYLVPGGFEPRDVVAQVLTNLRTLADYGIMYPPLLGFALPLLLGVIGFPRAPRFVRACFVFGILLAAPLFLATNFVEIRAHMPMLILILPAALEGLRATLDAAAAPGAADRVSPLPPVRVGVPGVLAERDPATAAQEVGASTAGWRAR